jgi:DNA (cytosine-5)-methyltransferase 1
MDSTALNHISLCTGYGGIDLGLSRVLGDRVRTVAYSEIEAFACANLVAKMEAGLLDPAPIWTDLKTFPWEKFRGLVDILSGGYPCQPFSAAGKRAGKDDPRHLWPWIADGIAILRPRFCFFENVEGHVTLGLRDVIEDLGRMGYRTTWGVFSAAEVGAPHQRKRVFILAYNQRQRIEELGRWFAGSAQHGAAWNGCAWPSRPGEPQHVWEPPRVVGNERRELDHTSGNGHRENNAVSARREGAVDAGGLGDPEGQRPATRRAEHEGLGRKLRAPCAGDEDLGDAEHRGHHGIKAPVGRQSEQGSGGLAESGDEDLADTPSERADIGPELCEPDGRPGRALLREPDATSVRQVKPALGRDPDGSANRLDHAELYVTCDNRTDELRLLGNGVVPATAERAFRVLMAELALP